MQAFKFQYTFCSKIFNRAGRRNMELAAELERMTRIEAPSGLKNRRAFTELGESAFFCAGMSVRAPCFVSYRQPQALTYGRRAESRPGLCFIPEDRL
jgi:hypothetical protein